MTTLNKQNLDFMSACVDFLKMPGINLEEFDFKTEVSYFAHKNKFACVVEETGDEQFIVHISDTVNCTDCKTCESASEFRDWLFTVGSMLNGDLDEFETGIECGIGNNEQSIERYEDTKEQLSNLTIIGKIDSEMMGNHRWCDLAEELLAGKECWDELEESKLVSSVALARILARKLDIKLSV